MLSILKDDMDTYGIELLLLLLLIALELITYDTTAPTTVLLLLLLLLPACILFKFVSVTGWILPILFNDIYVCLLPRTSVGGVFIKN